MQSQAADTPPLAGDKKRKHSPDKKSVELDMQKKVKHLENYGQESKNKGGDVLISPHAGFIDKSNVIYPPCCSKLGEGGPGQDLQGGVEQHHHRQGGSNGRDDSLSLQEVNACAKNFNFNIKPVQQSVQKSRNVTKAGIGRQAGTGATTTNGSTADRQLGKLGTRRGTPRYL